MYRLLIILVVLLVFVSCARDREWVEPQKSSDTDPNALNELEGRLVLTAPAAMEEVIDVYEDAAGGYARQVNNILKRRIESARFMYGPTLPNAADPVWLSGPYAGAQGANLVVLVDLEKIEEVPGINGPAGPRKDMKATILMRVLNAQGQVIWKKTHSAQVPNSESHKFRGSSSPTGRAVWNANLKCINALKDWLDAQSDTEEFGKKEPQAVAKPKATMHSVLISSDPKGADILVNGQFKGNTPIRISLPAEELEIKIERAGYEVWTRKLTPSEGMEVKPALNPKP